MAEIKSKVFKCVYCNKPHAHEVNRCQEKDRFLFPPHKLLGKTVGENFYIRYLIGESDMSVVYECQHASTEILYAIKFLKFEFSDLTDATGSFEKFIREAKDTEMIAHPNIVELEKIDVTKDGIPYLIMELLDGSDLGSLLSKWGKLPLKDAGDIIAQVLDAQRDPGLLRPLRPPTQQVDFGRQDLGADEPRVKPQVLGVQRDACLASQVQELVHRGL